jgi:hypothetical protein
MTILLPFTMLVETIQGRDYMSGRELSRIEIGQKVGSLAATALTMAVGGALLGKAAKGLSPKHSSSATKVPLGAGSSSEIIVRKVIPLDPVSELKFLRQSQSVGRVGQETFVTFPFDADTIVGMEAAFDKLTLNYPGTKFNRTGASIELEMKVPNQNFKVPDPDPSGFPTGTGFTEGGAMEFQIPSQSTNTIIRFRFHQNGRTSRWIEGNPFEK